MNYENIYKQLINKSKNLNRKKGQGIYYENHHIIPRACGGSDKKDNLVLLTAKEHFIAHMLLIEFVPKQYKGKMISALWKMCHVGKESKRALSASEYKYARELWSKLLSEKQKGKTLEERVGAERASEIKKKNSIGVRKTWEKNSKDVEWLKWFKNIQKNKKKTAVSRKGSDNPNFGKKVSKETIEKAKETKRKNGTLHKGHTEEVKKIIGKCSKESYKNMSEEKKKQRAENISKGKTGKSSSLKGRKFPDKIVSEETKRKMVETKRANGDYIITEEKRKLLSDAAKRQWAKYREEKLKLINAI